jgi:hypothetical protein
LALWESSLFYVMNCWCVVVVSYLFDLCIRIIIWWCDIKCCYMVNTCNMLVIGTCLSMLIIRVVWVEFIQLYFIYLVSDIRYIWSLVMIILSNHLFCVCVGFGIQILRLCVCRCSSIWWSSALIVTRGRVHIFYIESFFLLSYFILGCIILERVFLYKWSLLIQFWKKNILIP